jgi:tetratricopeptide (TPR) repeat protein
MRKALVFGALGLLFSLSAPAREESGLAQGYELLDRGDYVQAEQIDQELAAAAAQPGAAVETQAQAAWFHGQLKFHTGEYAESLTALERYEELNQGNLPEEFRPFFEQVRFLADLWKDKIETESDHFRIRVKPGKDQVLIEPSLAALEKAYPILTKELRVTPPGRILMEVYPDFAAFSKATGLSEKDVKTSGTIAVCKYQRFMVTSPRALVQGYNWLDAICHEFVHYLVYRRNGKSCPIWLHEGLAKYFEPTWRGDPGGTLLPTAKSLLATALRTDRLVSFERMHPTFAKLDSPEQGLLAFAQVTTTVAYLIHAYGQDSLFRVLDELNRGADYRNAILRVTGKPFPEFFAGWKEYAQAQHFQEIPGLEVFELDIKSGRQVSSEQPEEDSVSEADLKQNEAWKFVRLGDLLRNRGRFGPALVEFEKARPVLALNPRYLNKLGLTQIMAGHWDQALVPLELARSYYPYLATTYVNLGRAYAGKKDLPRAVENFEASLTVNPFDFTVYQSLLGLYQATHQAEMIARTEKRLAMIEPKIHTENPAHQSQEERKP